MTKRPAASILAALAARLGTAAARAALVGALAWAALQPALAASPSREEAIPTLTIAHALSIERDSPTFPEGEPGAIEVTLPDEWAQSRPSAVGPVWYRLSFDAPAGLPPDSVLAAYIERACSNYEVRLNGELLHREGRLAEPISRNCYYSDVVTLPAALVHPLHNVLDVKVAGYPLAEVAARQRAGGMSEVQVGPLGRMSDLMERHRLLNITLPQVSGLVLVILGAASFAVAWWRRAPYLAYFGLAALMWGLLSARVWWREPPISNGLFELLTAAGVAPVAIASVSFLLRYSGVRIVWLEISLWLQCIVMPVNLLMAGGDRLFAMVTPWYGIFAIEIAVASGVFLWRAWRYSRIDFWTMGAVLVALSAAVVIEVVTQRGYLPSDAVQAIQYAVPLLFVATCVRITQAFVRTMQSVETARADAERRVAEISTDLERNYAQLAAMRVEQMTAKERKRIAGDLHDDLGAKLLTIVHTSDNERIATLAREALEEMRLSVRGITGKPVNLGDAIGDWRSESMQRLSDGGVELHWSSPDELLFTDRTIGARIYVQTTRILREAISNMLKHSGASQCEIAVQAGDADLEVTIGDNGRGIPLELDGKLDRGHGMASMKQRAKNMHGQCLIESGPGYGTVIRLTLPLESPEPRAG